MIKYSYIYILILGFFLFLPTLVMAQDQVDKMAEKPSSNPNSLYPILNHDIMYKKKIWRRVNLMEKQNRPFFASNSEVTKVIIEAAKNKLLIPYADDTLKTVLSEEKFLENLTIPSLGGELTDEEKALGFGEDDDFGTIGDEETEEKGEAEPDYFYPQDVSILEIVEDMIFDKKRSRLYWDIQCIALIIPAEKFSETTNLEKTVAYFKFKDLVKVFRDQEDKALWYNLYNDNEKRNMADAFILRLFSGRIVKVSNPLDQDLQQELGEGRNSPKEVLMYSQIKEHQLMEFEHNLWDF